MDEVSFLVQRRIRLSHMVIVFLIRRHVDYFVRYARILRIGLVDLAVRRLNESVLVDPCVACKGVDQTDVRTFRRLDRTHSSVVGVVYVSHLESRTVSGKTARSQCGETSLVGQLAQRVVLVHELGQLGRSEELLHCRRHRLDIDQGLRRDALLVLCRHTLAHDSLQSGQTDPVLVLEQLAHRTDAAVAQMVDVIVISDAVFQMDIIVNGCNDVILRDMLRDQVVDVAADHALHLIDIACGLLDDACQDRIVYLLCHAHFLRVDVHNSLKIHHHIGKDLDISGRVLALYPQVGHG